MGILWNGGPRHRHLGVCGYVSCDNTLSLCLKECCRPSPNVVVLCPDVSRSHADNAHLVVHCLDPDINPGVLRSRVRQCPGNMDMVQFERTKTVYGNVRRL